MNDKEFQYYLDKGKKIDIRINHLSNDMMLVAIYNDQNYTSVGYTCSREDLKGLADFLYKTIGENK
jgi:ferritin